MKPLIALWLLLCLPLCVSATVIRVPDDYETIQVGIDASVEGDTVLVASGTYSGEGNRELDFHGKNIILMTEVGADSTAIDCEGFYNGFSLMSGESRSSLIEGFTILSPGYGFHIQNSSPVISGCNIRYSNAKAIFCEGSHSEIIDCNLMFNSNYFGGTIGNEGGALSIIGCSISNNTSTAWGGGIKSFGELSVIDCLISNNYVEPWSGYCQGGGIYSFGSAITVERCEISNNVCESDWESWVGGGGIYCEYGSAIISDCLIKGNSAKGGGGVKIFEPDFAVINNCRIIENYTHEKGYGGGISVSYAYYTTLISNCLISNNRAFFGGGVYCNSDDGFMEIGDCTITNNMADSTGGGSRIFRCNISFSDCISHNNYPEEITCDDGSAEVLWSNIEDGWPGEGNIDEDPLFVASEYGDYRLHWGSPCIDSGNPDSLDLDGTRSDMGAYSFDQSKELIVYLSPETGEIEPGETGRVKYTVCNAHPVEKNFGTAAGVRRPDGSPWPGNPLEEPFYTSIAPSSNLTREFEYKVPPGWLPGTYSLAAGVGYDARIYDLDHFEFAVK